MVIIRGKDIGAIVERVVPGKLVYVRVADPAAARDLYAFKLDKLVLRRADDSLQPYRGEPLSDLGVVPGRKVVTWGLDHPSAEAVATLVVDLDRPREFVNTLANTITTTITSSIASQIDKIFK
ncbi:MAG TPA: hypothetical protein VLX44_14425 [Xanthobacteraceae bacterium]|nr:hypothetical protein [Xanthobacteraceae bacterium]